MIYLCINACESYSLSSGTPLVDFKVVVLVTKNFPIIFKSDDEMAVFTLEKSMNIEI